MIAVTGTSSETDLEGGSAFLNNNKYYMELKGNRNFISSQHSSMGILNNMIILAKISLIILWSI